MNKLYCWFFSCCFCLWQTRSFCIYSWSFLSYFTISELFMCTVAKRCICCMLTCTKICFIICIGNNKLGTKRCSYVRTITKWLTLRLTTGTKMIFLIFRKVNLHWFIICNYWITHTISFRIYNCLFKIKRTFYKMNSILNSFYKHKQELQQQPQIILLELVYQYLRHYTNF